MFALEVSLWSASPPRPLEPSARTTLPIRKDTVWVPQPVWLFGRIEKCLAVVEHQIPDSTAGSLVSMSNT